MNTNSMQRLMLAGGLGAIGIGLPYILYWFGPAEAEIALWGWLSVGMGALGVALCFALRPVHSGWQALIVACSYATLALFQLWPTYLWIALHGGRLTDGPTSFVVQRGFALPHLAVALLALAVLRALWVQRGAGGIDRQPV